MLRLRLGLVPAASWRPDSPIVSDVEAEAEVEAVAGRLGW